MVLYAHSEDTNTTNGLVMPYFATCARAAAASPDSATVVAAIEALGLYRHDDTVRSRLQAAIAGRGDEIQRAFAKAFGK